MHSKYSERAVSRAAFLPLLLLLLLLLPVVLTGQRLQDTVIPVKNWAAPLYWQPNESERETAVGLTPKLEFSASQVSASALTFIAITPCRLVDTRGTGGGFTGPSPFSGPSIAPSTSVNFLVQSAAEATITAPAPCGTVPSIAQAYSFNVTVVDKSGAGGFYLSIYPTGSPSSVTTIVDYQAQPGVTLANAAIVPAGTPNGGITVFDSGPNAALDVIIDMNGFYAAPSDLNQNTAVGAGALTSNTSGSDNTATGYQALQQNSTGDFNVATGVNALQTNNGSYNTASGVQALQYNTTGQSNTAVGYDSLQANTLGGSNTALGYGALGVSLTGSGNTAVGFAALELSSAPGNAANTAVGYQALQGNSNTSVNTGTLNTAVGYQALNANTTGNNNTASGYEALGVNTTGFQNTAVGNQALESNTLGANNTAIGYSALQGNTTGGNNIAIGVSAGFGVDTGSNNIHIGSVGASGDSGIIRIGGTTAVDGYTQTKFFASGIYGVNLGGSAVSINSNGQLSSPSSSRRYKEDIHDMDDASRSLMDLRPVTFRYKKAAEDGSKPLQYGLIAEEVAEVYPDLVVYKNGQPDAVQYQTLPAMLLNEVQKQNQHAQQQDETIRRQQEQVLQQREQVLKQQEQIKSLEARLAALEASLSGKAPAAATAVR